jgi:hypothetical protein
MSARPHRYGFVSDSKRRRKEDAQCSLVDVFVVQSAMRQRAHPFMRLTAIAQFVAGRLARHSLLGSACARVISVSPRVSRRGSTRLNKAYGRSVHDAAPNSPSSMPSFPMRSTWRPPASTIPSWCRRRTTLAQAAGLRGLHRMGCQITEKPDTRTEFQADSHCALRTPESLLFAPDPKPTFGFWREHAGHRCVCAYSNFRDR